ncbi:hypothetical protein BGZ67_004330 [Mortierella alpina]|nr:hypothetical protein BGZ67_004330 [Mortierella alpina]
MDMPQAPEASWTGAEKRFSSDNNTIFIPNDHRISQVVVTFKDEASGPHQQYTDSQGQEVYLPKQRPSDRQVHPEATTVYITHHNYGRGPETGDTRGGVSGGASSGRFGSDKNVYVLNFSTSESLSEMIFKSAPSALHSKPILTMEAISPSEQTEPMQRDAKSQERPNEDVPNPARIRATATKASLTLSSDSSSSEMTTSTSATTTDGDYDEQEGAAVNTRPTLGSDDSMVQAQEGVVAGLALVSYWRNRASQSSSSHGNDNIPGTSTYTSTSTSASSSFTQNYITSPFSKKKKLTIPTIVLHPDEEDGEPPRVLSQKDIDYLSTMPPPPLRFLVQPWDDPMDDEEDEYGEEGAYNEQYDDDDDYSRHRPYRPYDEEEDEEEEEEDVDEGVERYEQRRYDAAGEDAERVDGREVERGGQAASAPDGPVDLDIDVEQPEKNEYACI